MRAHDILWLIPAAVAAPAFATTYLTVAQAQATLFPGQQLSPESRTLTPDQVAVIQKLSGTNVLSRDLKLWRAANGGWLIVDQVVGKHEFITLALGLDASGAVKGVEIMDYRESYGGEVRNPAWLAQFAGKRQGAALKLDGDIRNISGATLSSRHVTDAVKRLLATYAVALAV